MTKFKSAIHWFRKGLRLHDNPSLIEACKASAVYPIFILDPHFANPDYVGINRYCFLLQTLKDLDESLKKIGSRLYLLQGTPSAVLPVLFQKWDTDFLTFEADTEPYAIQRDNVISSIAKDMHVAVSIQSSHTLHGMDLYEPISGSNCKTTYGSFHTFFSSLPAPQAPIDAPSQVPSATSESNLKALAALESEGILMVDIPTLEEMGYPELSKPLLFPGGETEGLRRLSETISSRPEWVHTFKKPDSSPNPNPLMGPSTTVLSPYLKFGCVSPRKVWEELKRIQRDMRNQGRSAPTQPPVSLEGQLLWREFFYYHSYITPNFDRMEGHPRCRQIPWDRDAALIEAWKLGQTGYPFIDAIMTQLREEGWIHHLARHAVACFLTRGELWQHWEEGVKVFDLYLLDSDYALNNANWQWLSCSNFFHQYFRVYSPVAFGKKTDKNGDYIRHYIPQLKDMPAKYIYEPWTAPLSVQRSAGCIVGRDYPERVVDHDEVRVANMDKMKRAFNAGKEEKTSSDQDEAKPKKGSSSSTTNKKKRSAGTNSSTVSSSSSPAASNKKQRKMTDFSGKSKK